MPYVEGETLRDRLHRDKQLPIADAVQIATAVAGALDYAHRRGVIHRDIKPENIMLHDGQALLADFGIALALGEASGARMTETGLSLGTPQYMSPEQAAGERDIDARSDIYSLGAVTYEMLAGEPPVSGPTARAIIAKLMSERPTSLRVLRDSVSPALDAAVTRALAKAPADRFPTARDFADALSAQVTAAPATPMRRGRWAALAALVLLVAAGGVYLARRSATAAQAGADTVIRSIAVLPFDNYSADSTQDYFAEGMTDELTTDLATISALRVTSRGSTMQFAGKGRPPTPEIAKALGVDAIVEGSVTRSGDRVRITAQLIDARADRHLWAQSFERRSSDVLALQGEIASAIAQAINAHLTPGEQARLATAASIDPAAYDAYLKGRYFFNRPSDDNLRKAITQFDEAIRLAPGFAPAYSGLSDSYMWAGFNEGFITSTESKPRVEAASETAVRLDDNSAEAHTSRAGYLAWLGHDWEGSEREFQRAIALSPNYALAHDQYGALLAILGRFDEAIAEGRRALALDPLSPSILVNLAFTYVFERQVAPVKELVRRAAELDPTSFYGVAADAWLDLELGTYRDAVPKLDRARTMDAPPWVTALLGYSYGKSGDRARAQATLEGLKQVSPGGRVSPYNLAVVQLGLGDNNRALDHLEAAYRADSQLLVYLKVDRIYDPLRAEPRFIALMRQLNFAQ